jgi:hypothetical protein
VTVALACWGLRSGAAHGGPAARPQQQQQQHRAAGPGRPQPPARAAAAAAAIACHIMYAMHAALMLCCRFMNEWRLDDSLNEMHDLFLKLRV